MYEQMKEKVVANIIEVLNKITTIQDKYETGELMHVKDQADMERYSVILKNLSSLLNSNFYEW